MHPTEKILRKPAYSLIELLVVVMVSSVLIIVTISIYGLYRKSTTLDASRASNDQNARVAMDRLARDLRQANSVVTSLPASEIEFEDGHLNNLTYYRYYLNSTVLELDTKQYYFSYAPGTRVHWNDTGTGGVSPISQVLSTQDVATGVTVLSFSGDDLLNITLTSADALGQSYVLRDSVFGRNL